MAMKSETYEKNLKLGSEYERFVIEQWPHIYPKRTLSLRIGKYAQLVGETEEGVEIKLDQLIDMYQRIYIEQEEKAHRDNENYIISGIYRTDNTRLYLVGDYRRWFLFSKRYLQWLDKLDPPFLYRPPPTGTSIGFCIPLKNAKKLCLDYQEFNENKELLNEDDDEEWLKDIPIARDPKEREAWHGKDSPGSPDGAA